MAGPTRTTTNGNNHAAGDDYSDYFNDPAASMDRSNEALGTRSRAADYATTTTPTAREIKTETESEQALVGLFNFQLHPTILHPHLASTVSSVSTATRLSIRALAVIVETTLEMVRFSTSATVSTPEFMLNTVLQLVQGLRRYGHVPLGDLAYGVWQFSRNAVAQCLPHSATALLRLAERGTALGAYVMHSSYELAEHFVQTGFQVVADTATYSLRGAEESVRLIDALFGSTETSRALSAIMGLIKREIYDNSDFHALSSRSGTITAFSSFVRALTAFACLQCVTGDRTARRFKLALIRRTLVLDSALSPAPSPPLSRSSHPQSGVVTPRPGDGSDLSLATANTLDLPSPTSSSYTQMHDIEPGELRETGFVDGRPTTREPSIGGTESDDVATDSDPESVESAPLSPSLSNPETTLRHMEVDLMAHLHTPVRNAVPPHSVPSPVCASPISDPESPDLPPSAAPRARRSKSFSLVPPLPPRGAISLHPAPLDRRHKSFDVIQPQVSPQSQLYAFYFPSKPTSLPDTTGTAPSPKAIYPNRLRIDAQPTVVPKRAYTAPVESSSSIPPPHPPVQGPPIQPFPRRPIMSNIARFIRYASAAYGSRFMRIFGIQRRLASKRAAALGRIRETRPPLPPRGSHLSSTSASTHHPRALTSRRRSFQHYHHPHANHHTPLTPARPYRNPLSRRHNHPNHHSFATHTELPLDSILYSSYTNLSSLYEARIRSYRSAGGSQVRSASPPRGLLSHLNYNPGSQLPKPSLHALVHYISVDHDLSAIVLTCRGTLGLSDVLTDLFFHYAEFDLPYPDLPRNTGTTRPHYRTHAGVLQSAQLLAASNSPVFRELRDAMLQYPNYGLVFCGHSLGGGVAAILAILWSRVVLHSPDELAQGDTHYAEQLRASMENPDSPVFTSDDVHVSLQRPAATRGTKRTTTAPSSAPIRWFVTSEASGLPPNRPIHCYAYGVPCVASIDLAIYCRGLITSIANAHDVVPCLSLGLLHDFKNVATILAAEKEPLAEKIVQRTVTTLVRQKRVERTAQFKDLTVRSHRYVSASKRARQNSNSNSGSQATEGPANGHTRTHSPLAAPQSTLLNSSTRNSPTLTTTTTTLVKPSIPVGEYADWFWSLIQTMRASMNTEKLYPPGDVYILDNSPPTKIQAGPRVQQSVHQPIRLASQRSSAVDLAASPNHTLADGDVTDSTDKPVRYMSLYRCLDVTSRFFELNFSRSMFTEHSPKAYEDHIAALIRGQAIISEVDNQTYDT
ncbi:hypothetical protein H4R33_006747 [Dimargaris cristalligena]|nr:hypothetical protein H4R33_006747 [Dimargaris cristalligena]